MHVPVLRWGSRLFLQYTIISFQISSPTFILGKYSTTIPPLYSTRFQMKFILSPTIFDLFSVTPSPTPTPISLSQPCPISMVVVRTGIRWRTSVGVVPPFSRNCGKKVHPVQTVTHLVQPFFSSTGQLLSDPTSRYLSW